MGIMPSTLLSIDMISVSEVAEAVSQPVTVRRSVLRS
jgi:hypothetical protein